MSASWMHRALCRGANPEIFEEPGHTETALAYCQRCPVRAECLEYALALTPHVEGVWGGTTEDERARLRRGGVRRTCPSCRNTTVYSDGVSQICILCGFAWKI